MQIKRMDIQVNYLDSRIKNECFEGRSRSVKSLSLVDIMKSISSKSRFAWDSCDGGKSSKDT